MSVVSAAVGVMDLTGAETGEAGLRAGMVQAVVVAADGLADARVAKDVQGRHVVAGQAGRAVTGHVLMNAAKRHRPNCRS